MLEYKTMIYLLQFKIEKMCKLLKQGEYYGKGTRQGRKRQVTEQREEKTYHPRKEEKER